MKLKITRESSLLSTVLERDVTEEQAQQIRDLLDRPKDDLGAALRNSLEDDIHVAIAEYYSDGDTGMGGVPGRRLAEFIGARLRAALIDNQETSE